MFTIFQKKEKKDPICGMAANENFLSKYGEKFCSKGCMEKFEEKNQIANDDCCKTGGGCCG